MLRGKHRFRLLVQGPRNANLSRIIRAWIAPLTIPRTTMLHIDIDPYSFL
jgi:primosomal protein N' (replication factor Y) (superfamily II helicase)